MRSVCKNCHFAKKDGERFVCSRTLKYILAEDRCKRFAIAEDKGDIDKTVFISATVLLIATILISVICATM